MAGGWWRKGDGQRTEVAAAREAAQTSFYELDAARREAELSVETVGTMGDDGRAGQAVADFRNLSGRIEQVTVGYLEAIDTPDADPQARQRLEQSRRELDAKRTELDTFVRRLHPLVGQAEEQLALVAPAVAQARQALLAATTALDAARAAGTDAGAQAAALAALGPELTMLNEGAARHGVPATLRRAEELTLRARSLQAELS